MDRTGQTVSATDFSAMTGVARERLRTWERRFGFPLPERVGRGARRYAIDDAPRVVAVRRAAAQGVPLPRAIEAATQLTHEPVTDATLASVVRQLPSPALVVSGPRPFAIRYANAPLHGLTDELDGDRLLGELPWFAASELERTLQTLFATDGARAIECSHPAWSDGEATAHSIAYRLPQRPGESPAVAVVGIDRALERSTRRELQETRGALSRVRVHEERQGRWLALASALAERFQHDAGDAVLSATADMLVRRLAAVDAGVPVYMAGELALGTSSRGLMGPCMVPVTGYADLAALLQGGRPGWLQAAAVSAFGAPGDLNVLAVPILVVGETLGILLLLFDERFELDEDSRQLLTIVSAGLGFTLLRDRLVEAAKTR